MNVFLNLDSSDFLIEYVYYDSNNPEIINTDTAPFYLIENSHDSSSLLTNQDSVTVTNNNRDRSVVEIDSTSKSFALMTPNKLGSVYNDYDSKLTDTINASLNFTNPEGIVYDTVRIHLIQGFSFNDYFSGINLDIKVKDVAGNTISLLSTIYKVQDNHETMNPNPFLYSGRQYSSYIEYKIPSLRFLINSFKQRTTDDILSYKISKGQGFYTNTLLEISAGKFSETTKVDNQFFTRRISAEESSISSKDDFADIGVFINESNDGDYIDFFGTHNSVIFGDYMNRLNNSGTGQHIAIHKLIITEQLPNTTGEYQVVGKYNPLTNIPNLSDLNYLSNFTDGNYWIATETGYNSQIEQNVVKGNFIVYNPNLPSSTIKVEVIDSFDIENYSDIAQFIRTGDQEFIQDDRFDESNNFRPVLKYGGSALSYRIDYTLQVYNTSTNSTIEKKGSFISFEPNKYGKELLKLNTRDNIQVFDVFNKKVINNITNTSTASISNSIENSSLYSKNITSFKQSNLVYSGATNVSIDNNGEIVPKVNPEAVDNIKGQGLVSVYISPFDTFLQFGIYEQIEDDSFRSIDLDKIGIIYLNFTNRDGEIIKVSSIKNKNIDSSKGQVLFRIKPDIYNQVINSGNDVFFITSKVGDNSPESSLYTGKYKDYANLADDENTLLISKQQQNILDLNSKIKNLQSELKLSENEELKEIRKEERREKRRERRRAERRERRRLESIADNKTLDKKSINVKNNPFNPFGVDNNTET